LILKWNTKPATVFLRLRISKTGTSIILFKIRDGNGGEKAGKARTYS
jgi:hypothetical protein